MKLSEIKLSREAKTLLVIFAVYFFIAWTLTSVYFLSHTRAIGSGDWYA